MVPVNRESRLEVYKTYQETFAVFETYQITASTRHLPLCCCWSVHPTKQKSNKIQSLTEMEVFCATRGEREEADSQPIRQNLSRKVEIPNVEVHECQDYFNGHKTHVQFARLILYSKPN